MSGSPQLVAPTRRPRRPPRGEAAASPTGSQTTPLTATSSPSSTTKSSPGSGGNAGGGGGNVGGPQPVSSPVSVQHVNPNMTPSETLATLATAPGKQHLSEGQIASVLSSIIETNKPALLPSKVSFLTETNEERHDVPQEAVQQENARWRQAQQGRARTVHGLLFMCLNIGSDPPDVVKIEPCAKLECWMDPAVTQPKMTSTKGDIGEALEAQYRALQKEAIYKRYMDVSIEDVKQGLYQVRKKARDGRVMVHYNGHGMPKATHHGEIWFFDQQHTHYVPISFAEIGQHVESPTLYVLDCNSAGSILNYWRMSDLVNTRPRDILICACSDGETLPMNPVLPADVLTACLTTPVKMALEWYIHYSHRQRLLPDVTAEMIRNIPGELSLRKTPLGELQWIFTAVTDTIAWCTTPNELFFPLFRQDVLTKSLFRNFFLADKLLREVGCTPVSHPEIAGSTHSHHLWDAWDVAVESILCQLPYLLNKETLTPIPDREHTPSSFFVDQLTAFEVWIQIGDTLQKPEQLPSVLLCLNSNIYRVRALLLLCKYLNKGPAAVHNALFCGAMSYLVKLLGTPEMLLMLSVVWLQLLRVDPEVACAELQRAQAEKPFLRMLQLNPVTIFTVADDAPEEKKQNNGLNASGLFSSFGPEIPTATSTPAPQGAVTPPTATPQPGHTAGANPSTTANNGGASGSAATTPGAAAAEVRYHIMHGLTLERCQSVACYILSQMMFMSGEKAALSCWNANLLMTTVPLLTSAGVETRSWGALLLSRAVQTLRLAKNFVANEFAHRHDFIHPLLKDRSPIVRASCCTLLSTLLGFRPDTIASEDARDKRLHVDRTIFKKLCQLAHDPSPAVRIELVHAAALVLHHYGHIVINSGASSHSNIHAPSPANSSISGQQNTTESPTNVTSASTSVDREGSQQQPNAPVAINLDYILQHHGDTFELLRSSTGENFVVQSSLTNKRPTDNAEFSEGLNFTLQFAHKDEPQPSPDWGPITPHVRETLELLVHDAAVLLAHLHATPDPLITDLVVQCVEKVEHHTGIPYSMRIETEGDATMQGITTQRSSVVVSELDRARQLRNHDLARQAILDLSCKHLVQFDPKTHSSAVPSSVTSHNTASGPTGAAQSGVAAVGNMIGRVAAAGGIGAEDSGTASFRPHHTIAPLFNAPQETLICGAFRTLEPQVVVANRLNQISVVGYEFTLDKPCTTLHQFHHANDALITGVHIVNDLAENPLLMAIDRQGRFTLYRDAFVDEPSVCMSFTAPIGAGEGIGSASLNTEVCSAFRPRDAALFYANHGNSINVLSLAEERLVQSIPTPGETMISAMWVDGAADGRALYSGFSDGSVKFFDDRTGNEQLALVSVIEDTMKTGGGRSGPIVGLGCTSSAANHLYTCTPTTLKVFDVRKPKTAVYKKDIAGPTAKPTTNILSQASISTSFGAGQHATNRQHQTISGFSVCPNYPTMCTLTSDGFGDLYSHKGESLLSANKPYKAKEVARGIALHHPLKTLGMFGNELVLLH